MNGDRARVSVAVAVPPADAFRIFTEQIDLWWRRGATIVRRATVSSASRSAG